MEKETKELLQDSLHHIKQVFPKWPKEEDKIVNKLSEDENTISEGELESRVTPPPKRRTYFFIRPLD